MRNIPPLSVGSLTRLVTALLACWLGGGQTNASQPGVAEQLSSTQYSALVNFYNQAGGSGWTNNSGWLDGNATFWTGATVLGVEYDEMGNVSKPGWVAHIGRSGVNAIGTISSSLSSLTGLETLFLGHNSLSGGIPSSLGSLGSLRQLGLGSNQLTGSIPSSLGNLSNLQVLGLYENELSGTIPVSLGNLSQLRELWLPDNLLTGSIPASLVNLAQLRIFSVSENQLSGQIPEFLGQLTNLERIDLNDNLFTGPLPGSLGALAHLRILAADSNQLDGEIPAELGDLSELEELFLSHNQLTGEIPASLGGLVNLIGLGLEDNQLSGSIPEELSALVHLEELALDHNLLAGRVPQAVLNLPELLYVSVRDNYITLDSEQRQAFEEAEWAPETFEPQKEPLLTITPVSGSMTTEPLRWEVPAPSSLSASFTIENMEPEVSGLVVTVESQDSWLRISTDDMATPAMTASYELDKQGGASDTAEFTIHLEPGTLQPGQVYMGCVKIFAGGREMDVPVNVGPILTMHRVESIALANGFATEDIDAPLVPKPVASSLALSSETAITGGLICDGVTPLLVKLQRHNVETQGIYSVGVRVVSGGSVQGGLASHFRTFSNGSWLNADASGFGVLTVQAPGAGNTTESYAYVSAIPADELFIGSGSQELNCEVICQEKSAEGNLIGPAHEITFRLRKPPVVLVHGYNADNGTWRDPFLNTLRTTRHDDPTDTDSKEDFIRLIQYGVAPDGDKDGNTFAPLSMLASALHTELSLSTKSVEKAPFLGAWAMTRYDVVGHSQGGVLTRMLCTKQGVGGIPAFRNTRNSFRGRFHRVVTIGSPHNGSRLVHYLLANTAGDHGQALGSLSGSILEYLLDRFDGPSVASAAAGSLLSALPTVLPGAAVDLGLIQPKFDPWQGEIRTINQPGGIWTPDTDARFHLVRTRVNQGVAPPDTFGPVPLWRALNLHEDGRGDVVLPFGSDGIVDWASAGAGMASPYVTTITSANHAHVGGASSYAWVDALLPENLKGQTESSLTAAAAVEVLDGLRPVGSFVVPPLLPPAEGKTISDLGYGEVHVHNIVQQLGGGQSLGAMPFLANASSATLQADASTMQEARFRFSSDPSHPPVAGQRYVRLELINGTNITSGYSWMWDTQDPDVFIVSYDPALAGDLVVYTDYTATDGKLVAGLPVLVASLGGVGALTGIELSVPDTPVPVGSNIAPRLVGIYDDESRRTLFLEPFAADFQSSAPTVLDTSFGLVLRALAPGNATVSVQYLGFSSSADVVVEGAEIVVEQPAGTSLVDGTASIPFGNVSSDSSVDLTFTVKNTGNTELELYGTPKVVISGTDAELFTVTEEPTALVNPSESTTFIVRFAPASTGAKTAALSITTNDSDENPFDITLTGGLTAAESWRQQHFGTITNTGTAADDFDFDNDGLPNLLEWACNLNPTTASTLPATANRNGANLEFIYTRSVAALNAGAVFTVEWSDTLVALSWSIAGVSETILSDNGTVQQVKATLPKGGAGRRFVHLKVTAPP